ncbi:hypothetical protein EZ449_14240 [Pedobacter frigidisoli]|uniref:Plasmid transfer protein n=1 Tax=Pedobacter frigidisoli TaxID=2530455 RepID=A0A4R0NZ32_9SPHI|nr:hypothetical protein [Pedobacter frigidisoli]TCD07691.1 hypothetical protein EZ449_14240 [Pedobacter frigidisoli]
MKALPILLLLSTWSAVSFAQLNVALLHQLIADSKSEHQRQISARDHQALTSANESMNSSSLSRLKSEYARIQSRFTTLGSAIDLLQISSESGPILSHIAESQAAIISYCSSDPLLIPLAASGQIDLVDRSQLLLRYIYGLALSAGDLGQMRQSDRKLLFSFVISELKEIRGAARGLQSCLQFALRSKKGSSGIFPSFLERDRVLIENILRNSRTLKN